MAIKDHPITYSAQAEPFDPSRGPDGSLTPTCPKQCLRDGLELVIRQHIQHGTLQTNTVKIPLDPVIKDLDSFYFVLCVSILTFDPFACRQKTEKHFGLFYTFHWHLQTPAASSALHAFQKMPRSGSGGAGRWWCLGGGLR